MPIAYTIEIGSLSISSEPEGAGPPLISLRVDRGMGGTGGRASIELGQVGADAPATGESVHIELDAGEGRSTVFSGEVDAIEQEVSTVVIKARDGLARLGEHELERGYEEVSVGFIIKDLVEASGAEVGEIEDGPSIPRYALHGPARALQHAAKLGELIGAELYTDGKGRVCFARPSDDAAVHTLRFGEHLLRLDLEREPLRSDSLAVWGEGAAGTEGAEREHWLTTDLSGVAGEASVTESPSGRSVSPNRLGSRPRTLIDGAVRSVDAADEIASAKMQGLALRPIRGSVLTLGLVDIAPGSWIELVDLPSADLRLRVRHFVHQLSPRGGLTTELRF